MEKWHTLTIIAPNVLWNTYELLKNISFWGKETWHIKVKDQNGKYANEEREIKADDWRVLEYEIGLINWLIKDRISKQELETIRSSAFKELEKGFLNKSTLYVYAMLDSDRQTDRLMKKHWAIELWGEYQNNYKLTGVGTFKYNLGTKYTKVPGGCVGSFRHPITGQWFYTETTDGPQWEWLERYRLLY